MKRIGDAVFQWDGYWPKISLPDPGYGRLSTAQRFLDSAGKILTLIGAVAALLGIPFGVPLLSVAIMLLVGPRIVRHMIIQPEPAKLRVETPAPTLTRSCPEYGEEIDDTPDACPKCSWTSDNPVDP